MGLLDKYSVWDSDRIPLPPLEFRQKVYREIAEARRRAEQILEEAGMIQAQSAVCKNHPDRPAPARGTYAKLCEECRDARRERLGLAGNSGGGSGNFSVAAGLKTLMPAAKKIDRKVGELSGKKRSIAPLEQEVDNLLRDFEKSVREMMDGISRLPQ